METSFVKTFNFDEHRDLKLLFAGKAQCGALHSYGPAVRPNYIFHIVTKGNGLFFLDNQRFEITAGMGFLIPPEFQTFYQADREDPWEYYWLAFTGELADQYVRALGFDLYHPVFEVADLEEGTAIIEEAIQYNQQTIVDELMLNSLLYRFLAIVKKKDTNPYVSKNQNLSPYVQATINYIKDNYTTALSINVLSQQLSLNRSYLSSLFKKEMGITLQRYISDYRLSRAKELLSLTNFSIEEISEYSGYHDPLVFSKAFKRKTGMTPTTYRKRELNKQNEFSKTGKSLLLNEHAEIIKDPSILPHQ